MPEVDLVLILMLACVALLAGFFDAIAGGGGLITLPALMIAGIDPVTAIATNKVQAASASVSATAAFAKKGMIEWRSGLPMALTAFIGGAAGALALSSVPKGWLQALAPVLLILVAAYFAFSPKLDNEQRRARFSASIFCITLVPLIAFYDGVFGPGTGSFFMVAFVVLMGQGLLRAVSNSKLLNASSNLGALVVFSMTGAIIVPIALAMAVAAVVGAQLGARCALRYGQRLIKPLLVSVCCLMAGKLLITPDNPLNQFLRHYFS
ncbi:TSUP family transporter [Pseudomonas sp. R5(2019)]|uniref:TSUP family transporter n=1 Tax=Pseudomonas sp. R5(2019) TaxID=2697566 RepID=UPI001412A2BC|nr:TSUP family transporter [Pseudomonas sp. R5(2019)]NBA96129.1 TSUP family transporter [Pseudomonas sp. R5(2019)]